MAEVKVLNKLELHYFFNDDDESHSMDAITRNKCEHELLQIVSAISKELEVSIRIETEAYEEGGLKEFYTFFGTAQGQAIVAISTFAISILSIILSRLPGRKSKLDKEEQRLSIEEKKLNIALLKLELEAKKVQTPSITIEKIEYLITNNIKIIKHKSNFYKTLIHYPKVKALSTVELDENKKPIGEPKIIERKEFSSFILESDDIDSLTDENAIIEIISPVLKVGKYKWRGLYNQIDYPIEFSMNDKKFKEDVIKDAIPFKSGSFIDCVLEISRKIDDLGNVYNSSYKVLTVLKHHEDGVSSETPQGKKFRQKKEAAKLQYNLFDNQGESN